MAMTIMPRMLAIPKMKASITRLEDLLFTRGQKQGHAQLQSQLQLQPPVLPKGVVLDFSVFVIFFFSKIQNPWWQTSAATPSKRFERNYIFESNNQGFTSGKRLANY